MGKGGVSLPGSMARAHWIKALKELPRVVGSPWIGAVASVSPSVPTPDHRGRCEREQELSTKALHDSGSQPLFC